MYALTDFDNRNIEQSSFNKLKVAGILKMKVEQKKFWKLSSFSKRKIELDLIEGQMKISEMSEQNPLSEITKFGSIKSFYIPKASTSEMS